MQLPRRLRTPLYLLSILGAVGLLLAALWLNWYCARERQGCVRLRWYLVTAAPLLRGTQIREDDLRGRLGRLPMNAKFVARRAQAVGLFTQVDLLAGELIRPSALSPMPAVDIPAGGAVVSLEVPSPSVAALRPGMRIYFSKKSAESMKPDLLPLENGDIIICAIGSSDKASHKVLTVAVPTLLDAQSLAEPGWLPFAPGPPLVVEQSRSQEHPIPEKKDK